MKFGKKFEQLSVPAWKNYNLDYAELKSKIRGATDTPQTVSYKQLRAAFVGQIDFVSLFVVSKSGELERRLLHYHQALQLVMREGGKSLSYKQRLYLSQQIALLLSDLKKLARFILIQKLALKKLIKKFLKHSTSSQPGSVEALPNTHPSTPPSIPPPQTIPSASASRRANRLVSSVLHHLNSPPSFLLVDLTPLILELAFFHECLASPTQAAPASTVPTTNVSFDLTCAVTHHTRAVYAVDDDVLQELRLNLITSKRFRLVNDNLPLSKTQSLHNLSRIQPSRLTVSLASTYAIESLTSYIYLSNGTEPPALVILTQGHATSLVVSSVGGLRGYAHCELSNELLNSSILALVSGEVVLQRVKRAGVYTGLAKMAIDWILEKGLVAVHKVWMSRARYIEPQDSSRCLTLDTQIRFSNQDLTVGWDTTGAQTFRYSLLTIHHHEADATAALAEIRKALAVVLHPLLDFCWPLYLSARFSNQPHPVDSISFKQVNEDAVVVVLPPLRRQASRLELMVGLPGSRHSQGSLQPSRAMTPARNRSAVDVHSLASTGPLGHHLATLGAQRQPPLRHQPQSSRVPLASPPVRYWNEFDNGSEGEDSEAFYVDEYQGFGGEDGWNDHPNRLRKIIDYLIQIADKVGGSGLVDVEAGAFEGSVPPQARRRYSLVGQSALLSLLSSRSTSATSLSDCEFVPLINHEGKLRELSANLLRETSPDYGTFDPEVAHGELHYQQRHDQMVTVVYFLCFFFSVLVMGVSSGVIYSIDATLGDQSTSMLLLLITTFSLVLSFVSGILAGWLIMMRFNAPPVWHHAVVWGGISSNFAFLVWGVVTVVQ